MSGGGVVNVSIFLAMVASVLPLDVHAAWNRSPNANAPIGTGTGLQVYPAILEDGNGGAFIAWHDNRGPSYDLYIQRVNAKGVPLWTTNGVAACSASGDQANAQLVSDGAGGVIVTWHDFRAGNWDVYVQRFNANGVPQWTANGVALCTATGDQTDPNIVSDGQGGAVVAWPDGRPGTRLDVYARRVNAAGVPQWAANGVLVCGAAGTRGVVRLIADGPGGAILTWEDTRGGIYKIYAQRLNGSGVPQWLADGTIIGGPLDSNRDPAIVSDGVGGAFVAWSQIMGGNRYLRMQRVDAAGFLLWNETTVADGSGDQRLAQIVSDGAGGAIVTWQNANNANLNFEIYVQRKSSAGARMWGSNGVAATSAPVDDIDPRLVSDGSGGAVVTWGDYENERIQAQRLSSTGTALWGSAGVLVSTASGGRAWPRIATDGNGGAIVAWHDTRSGNHDVYAQRVDRYGYLGNVEPVIRSVRDVANDQGGKVKVSWNASDLDAYPSYTISDYRLWRSVPNAVTSGISRAITSDPDLAASGDALLVMSTAGTTTAWEVVTTQPAAELPTYSLTTSTSSDSVAGSNPRTWFMVEARTGVAIASPRWFSAPDSGYSVDNIPPAPPSALAGSFANGTTALRWAANGEADLSNYRLYRGTDAGFTPAPENQIASPAGTRHDDAGGAPFFYKLSAVDLHGNESGFALLAPVGTLDVPGARVPLALRLGVLEPNPAAHVTRVAFDLPRSANVSLVVYDASGRTVRTLVREERPAGAFGMTWDLRDDAGRRVADGVYFVRLVVPGQTLHRRMVVMR